MLSWLFSNPLAPGSAAPGFTLLDQDGNPVSLEQHRGHRNVILFFYPADDTPGCTRQACDARDNWTAAVAKDTVVYGVNPGGAKSHRAFREKYQLPFPLLIDSNKIVAKLYNASGPIIKRTVYLIGKDGTIRFAQRGMPSLSEVLTAAQL